MPSQILLSTGASFGTGFNPATARQFVEGNGPVGGLQVFPFGYGFVVTKGASGWDVVQSNNAATDALLQAATALAPFKLGVDDIYLTPLQIPEPPNGL